MVVREQDEGDTLELGVRLEVLRGRSERDRGRPLDREAVDAGRDRWEGNRAGAELRRDLERAAVGRLEQLVLAGIAARPDRADRVDHPASREVARRGRLRVACVAASEAPALREDRRAAGTVDRAVDAAAAEERRVRGVHDRVDLLPRDVALRERDAHTA